MHNRLMETAMPHPHPTDWPSLEDVLPGTAAVAYILAFFAALEAALGRLAY